MRAMLAILAVSISGAVLGGGASGPPKPAPDPEVREALAKARYDLKDPESAKFRNLFKYTNSRGFLVVCGEMNAKNSYGAYSGFERFAATKLGASIAPAGDIARNVLLDTSCGSQVNDTKVMLDANDYQ